eukprot:Gb_11958 [translate_table: standard]
MRLLTHNMLSCNIKGVTKGFPLELEVENFVTKEAPFNADFLKHIFSKIEWKALHDAAKKMGVDDLPEQAEVSMLEHEDFLRRFHHALLELHLEEGALICPETGRRFPVNKGIPNMLLHEDEIEAADKLHSIYFSDWTMQTVGIVDISQSLIRINLFWE